MRCFKVRVESGEWRVERGVVLRTGECCRILLSLKSRRRRRGGGEVPHLYHVNKPIIAAYTRHSAQLPTSHRATFCSKLSRTRAEDTGLIHHPPLVVLDVAASLAVALSVMSGLCLYELSAIVVNYVLSYKMKLCLCQHLYNLFAY